MKKLILCIGCLGFFSLYPVHASTRDVEALPLSWYTLPEDQPDTKFTKRSLEDLSADQLQGVDRIFNANGRALEYLSQRRPKNRDNNDWRLEACMFDVTLSISGVLGMLVAEGDPSVAVYWHRSSTKASQSTLDKRPDLQLNSNDTGDDIAKKLEPLMQAVLATQMVDDEPALRKNLTEKILDTHEIVQFITAIHSNDYAWAPNRFRLDIEIDVNGQVGPVTTVGGGVKLHFDWFLSSQPHSIPKTSKARNAEIGDGVKDIVENLLEQMQEVKYQDIGYSGFDLSSVRFGLSLFGSGSIGLIKVSGDVFGYVYLAPNTLYKGKKKIDYQHGSVPVIDASGNSNWARWAFMNNIPAGDYPTARDGSTAKVYDVLADRFRTGLQNSAKMGAVFATRASQQTGDWHVFEIAPDFSISLSGDLVLYKLGGTGDIALTFMRP